MKTSLSVPAYVADTHAIVWHILGMSSLSTEAYHRLVEADRGDAIIYISAMSLIEIVYLQEKGRLHTDVFDKLQSVLSKRLDESYHIVSITSELVQTMCRVPYSAVPDMPDRIIAATALHLDVPLITKDQRLQNWRGITTVW